MHIEWAFAGFIVTQLMTFAALRQQVKNLADEIAEEKSERKQIDERVRELEIATAPTLARAKRQGT